MLSSLLSLLYAIIKRKYRGLLIEKKLPQMDNSIEAVRGVCYRQAA
jgi:hypothetical protein